MNGRDEHERRNEDLAAYMLGALEPGEAAELEGHLAGCERCRAELRWLAPAVRSLPEAVERREPPRQLRERLLAEVRADARRDAAAARPRSGRGWLSSWLRGSPPRRLRLASGLAVAALLVVAVAGYEVGQGGGGDGSSTLISRQPNGIEVTMVREGDGGTLRLANVGALPPQKVLEAWVQREGKVEPVPALFVPDRAGRASTTIADMRGVEAVMVTEEPPGGSRAPTSKPIATMSVPQ